MSSSLQLDLFATDEPAEASDEEYRGPVFSADPDEVRAELHELLATARSAETMPWGYNDARLWKTVFPQMANWLPTDEADQLRRAFAAELARLEGAK